MDMSFALDPGAVPAVTTDPRWPGADPNDATSIAFASLLASLVASAAAPLPTPVEPMPEPTAPVAAADLVAAVGAPVTAEVPMFAAVPAALALPAAPTAPVVPVTVPTDVVAPAEATVTRAAAVPTAVVPAEATPTIEATPIIEAGPTVAVPVVPAAPAPAAVNPATVAAEALGTLTLAPEPEPAPPELAPTLFSSPAPVAPTRNRDEKSKVEADDVAAPKAAAPTAAKPTAVQLPSAVLPVAPTFSSPIRPEGGQERDQKDRPAPVAPVTHPSAHVVPAPVATPVREILKPEIVERPMVASPVEQVVKAVAPLRRLTNGTHNLVLELHPAELGAVRVELSLDSGIVHLGLRAEEAATGQLLRAALPELRSQLEAAGVSAGRVAVDSGQAGRRDAQPMWRTDPDGPRRPVPTDEPADDVVAPSYSSSAYGQIDVLL